MGAPIFSPSRVDTDTAAIIVLSFFFSKFCFVLSCRCAGLGLFCHHGDRPPFVRSHEMLTPVVVVSAQCNARRRVESSSRRHASSSYCAPSRFLLVFNPRCVRLYISAHAVRGSSCSAALFMEDPSSGEKTCCLLPRYCAGLYGVRLQVFAAGCATNGPTVRRKGVHCSWSMSECSLESGLQGTRRSVLCLIFVFPPLDALYPGYRLHQRVVVLVIHV